MARWSVLCSLIEEYQLKVGVEIGVKSGRNIRRVLNRCPNFKFYGVDPWEPTDGYEHWSKKTIRNHENEARIVQDRFPGRCRLMKMYSTEAARKFADASVDLVFIDGEHTYDAVVSDIMCWLPKVREGGVISGHDYRNERAWRDKGYDFSGVEQAVDEIFGNDVNEAEDYVWWVRV